MMTKELQDYYEARFEMFSSKGWADLIEDTKKIADSVENIRAIKDLDDLRFKQGELSIINWLIGLEEISQKAYEELKNEES